MGQNTHSEARWGQSAVLWQGSGCLLASPPQRRNRPFSTALSALLSSRNEACDLQWRQTSPTCVFIVPCCKMRMQLPAEADASYHACQQMGNVCMPGTGRSPSRFHAWQADRMPLRMSHQLPGLIEQRDQARLSHGQLAGELHWEPKIPQSIWNFQTAVQGAPPPGFRLLSRDSFPCQQFLVQSST